MSVQIFVNRIFKQLMNVQHRIREFLFADRAYVVNWFSELFFFLLWRDVVVVLYLYVLPVQLFGRYYELSVSLHFAATVNLSTTFIREYVVIY